MIVQDLDREGGIETIIALASLEDMECQEYAAFALAHLASNKDLQVQAASPTLHMYTGRGAGIKEETTRGGVHNICRIPLHPNLDKSQSR